jgi:phosphoglycolate phosphatase
VGDTSFDMGMAVAAGAAGIGAGWGYHEPHELIAGGARTVAADPSEVAKIASEAVHG